MWQSEFMFKYKTEVYEQNAYGLWLHYKTSYGGLVI